MAVLVYHAIGWLVETIAWIAMTFYTVVRGSWGMNSTDYGDSLAVHLAPPPSLFYLFIKR